MPSVTKINIWQQQYPKARTGLEYKEESKTHKCQEEMTAIFAHNIFELISLIYYCIVDQISLKFVPKGSSSQ